MIMVSYLATPSVSASATAGSSYNDINAFPSHRAIDNPPDSGNSRVARRSTGLKLHVIQ